MFWMEVTFRIGAGTAPGTELVNQADVTLAGDQDPNNNHAEYQFPHAGARPQPARHQVV